MTGVFDGMTGVLTDVFGAPVEHSPAAGAAATISGIFREEPVEVADNDGRSILILAPTLRVARPASAAISIDDTIRPGNGRSYRVLNRASSGSPAADAFEIFELEDLNDA